LNAPTTAGPPGTPIGKEEKARLEALNQQRLDADLQYGRLAFESRPRVVEIQLSNFCNMSCTMCYDGENPPTKMLPEPVVEALAAELFPTASVFVPFATSEPLILTWDLTRRLAEHYGVELEITTNVQFLDEKKLAEVEPIVGAIEFSIDSHIREVFDSIRLRARSDKVFRNLPIAARYLRERGVDVSANIVFMTVNAPHVHDTVAFLADAGVPSMHIQKLFYTKPDSHLNDPVVHFSKDWIARMKARVRKVAEEKKVKVAFDFDGYEVVNHQPKDAWFRPRKSHETVLEDLRRTYPGYCPQSVYRLKVDNDGNAYPCCVGVGERLKLGNVKEQPFEEIWNGPTNQDLRRGMLTGDVPDLCLKCNFRTGPIPTELRNLPFCEEHNPAIEAFPDQWTIELLDPPHLTRAETMPAIRWKRPEADFDHYELVFSLGGKKPDALFHLPKEATSFEGSADLWDHMVPNAAYWWTIWAVNDADRSKSLRAKTIRAVVHHKPIPRVAGSTLVYPAPAAPPEPSAADEPSRAANVLKSLAGRLRRAVARER
jgi:radical SAM protein with 4Fe4S-binding SPASM domain